MTAAGGSEILVVISPAAAGPSGLLAHGRLVHSISDRVVTIELAPEASLDDVRSDPAVRWAGHTPPDAVLAELDPEERLFVEGWLRRGVEKPERPGEGLDWDTPGRLPPDPPR